MTTRNKYPGYLKVPNQDYLKTYINLDFNFQINHDLLQTKINGFNLRVYPSEGPNFGDKVEIGISLTKEQWLDLIDAMKSELEACDTTKAQFDE